MKSLLSRYKNVVRSKSESASIVADNAVPGADSIPTQGPVTKKAKVEDTSGEISAIPSISSSTDYVNIVFECLEGSVTHYFHFFYGALVPLILHALENGHGTPSAPLYCIVTDIGPMKRILCELPLNIIELRGPELTSSRFHDDKSQRRARRPDELALKAFDAYNNEFYTDGYVEKLPKSKLRKIVQFFEDSMPSYLKALPVFDIILIERATDSYYSTACKDRTEIYKSSGSERRSLSNHQQLVATLCERYGSRFCNIVLERSSIYYQYMMFCNAKVVIAQHGAALSNIIFMMPTGGVKDTKVRGTVVEINPPWSRQAEHFKNLAHSCGVPHASVLQTADHSDVDITQVVELTDKMLADHFV